MKRLLPLLVLPGLLLAQTPPPQALDLASVSGAVKDSLTGEPIPNVAITASGGGKRFSAQTDSQGAYAFHDVPSAAYQIVVMPARDGRTSASRYSSGTRNIHVKAGDHLTSIDFHLDAYGSVTGTVYDSNHEPQPGISLVLVGREYYLGTARYVYSGVAGTNDEGHYAIRNLEAGRAYLILAMRRESTLPAQSDVPLDPKRRRAVLAPTFYPKSSSIAGAIPIAVKGGEEREDIDIEMPRSEAFCLEAVTTAGGAPAGMNFEIAPAEPESGSVAFGGYFGFSPHGRSPESGKIRVCNLVPGSYRLVTTADPGDALAPPFYGASTFGISDRDLRDYHADARPAMPLSGEVQWAAAQPNRPAVNATIGVMPLARGRYVNEGSDVRTGVPGPITLAHMLEDTYQVRVATDVAGVYVKDATYGGFSVLHGALKPGTAPGNATLRIELENNGGAIAAKVADADGNPVSDINVYVFSSNVTSEAELSTQLISGYTDSAGMYRTSLPLAPGKYMVVATTAHVTMSADSMARLWRSHSRGTEVDVAPGMTAPVTLQPVAIQ